MNKTGRIITKYCTIATCCVSVVFILIVLLYNIISSGDSKDIGAKSIYKCDYIIFALKTNIKIYNPEDTLLYSIEGKTFTFDSNPLTLYDEKQNHTKIMYVEDEDEDSHSIQSFLSKESLCEMKVNNNFSGDSFELYKNGTYIGKASFNFLSTYGEFKTDKGDLIADFTRGHFSKDYTVQIRENNVLSDEVLLMIYGSYAANYLNDEDSDD